MPPAVPILGPAAHALLAALALALAAAVATDLRWRIIPNRLVAAVACAAPAWWWAAGFDGWAVAVQLGAGAATLLGFGALFAAGLMGGGDVKLLAGLALWLPPPVLGELLVDMALAGGALTLLTLAWHRWRARPGRPEVPYGVAIALAGWAVVANNILTAPRP